MGDEDLSLPATQQAWTWLGKASPKDLKLATVPMPSVGHGEVLVRNQIVGLNPVDWKVLKGLPSWSDGHIPGVDGAGVVAAVGDERLKPLMGLRVAYHQSLNKHGSFAQYTPVASRALMRVPDDLGLPLAASIPCPALTAWLALDKLPVRERTRMLLSGAGGAVGNYLVQLAIQRDFAVTAMCNNRHWDRMRRFGVRKMVAGPISSDQDLPTDLLGRYFAVVDAVGGDHAARISPALGANGHLVCIQDRLQTWPSGPFTRCISMHEVALGALHEFGSNEDWARLVMAGETIMRQVASGRLEPEPLIIRDFSDLPELLTNLQSRSFSGKPLLKVN